MLDIDKIDVCYGEVQVLRQVSLKIKAEQVVSLLGTASLASLLATSLEIFSL